MVFALCISNGRCFFTNGAKSNLTIMVVAKLLNSEYVDKLKASFC